MKKTTIYLPEELDSGLDAISKSKHRPKADLIREAVDRYICDEGRRLPSFIGMIDDDDGTLSARNTEAWLEANWHPK